MPRCSVGAVQNIAGGNIKTGDLFVARGNVGKEQRSSILECLWDCLKNSMGPDGDAMILGACNQFALATSPASPTTN